jgi:PAS domain S-box-containing protein
MKGNQRESDIRQRAEEKLKEAAAGSAYPSEAPPESMASLIHELQVHQIELEMQNDELRRVQRELEKTRDKYSHLYDFSLVGYFTLTEKGIIDESNLPISSMLGVERATLIGKPFNRFVFSEDQDVFYKLRHRLLETEESHTVLRAASCKRKRTCVFCQFRMHGCKKQGRRFQIHQGGSE